VNRDSEELLIEAATGAFRERDASGRILPSPAWMDLSEGDRERLFKHQIESRLLESSLDPKGLSSTARAVLGRLPHLGQFPGSRE
jgi:hypothetical protein